MAFGTEFGGDLGDNFLLVVLFGGKKLGDFGGFEFVAERAQALVLHQRAVGLGVDLKGDLVVLLHQSGYKFI